METDKRRFERYVAEHLALAVFRPNFKKLGKIRDVSRGGLSFEYMTSEGRSEGRMEDSLEIDIFVSGARFHMRRVAVRTIYDQEVVHHDYTFAPLLERRRCGVQFGEMSQDQTEQLVYFLEAHTTGLAR